MDPQLQQPAQYRLRWLCQSSSCRDLEASTSNESHFGPSSARRSTALQFRNHRSLPICVLAFEDPQPTLSLVWLSQATTTKKLWIFCRIGLYAERLVGSKKSADDDPQSFRQVVDEFDSSLREIEQIVSEVTTTSGSLTPRQMQNLLLAPILLRKLPRSVKIEWPEDSHHG